MLVSSASIQSWNGWSRWRNTLMPVETEMTMPEYGAVDQVHFETKDADFFNQAKSRLDEVEIPYQTLQQDNMNQFWILLKTVGFWFIFTLQK